MTNNIKVKIRISVPGSSGSTTVDLTPTAFLTLRNFADKFNEENTHHDSPTVIFTPTPTAAELGIAEPAKSEEISTIEQWLEVSDQARALKLEVSFNADGFTLYYREPAYSGDVRIAERFWSRKAIGTYRTLAELKASLDNSVATKPKKIAHHD